jgi:hypothetical protein
MLNTDEGIPASSTSPVSEPDTQLQRQSIIDLYAGLIKESEAFRREIKDELTEVRNLRAELQQERENFRDATYRLTQALRNINPIVTTNIGIAADK